MGYERERELHELSDWFYLSYSTPSSLLFFTSHWAISCFYYRQVGKRLGIWMNGIALEEHTPLVYHHMDTAN